MSELPTYELLVVELQATLEALIQYSKSDCVKQLAKKRKAEIEKIQKDKDGLYVYPKTTN